MLTSIQRRKTEGIEEAKLVLMRAQVYAINSRHLDPDTQSLRVWSSKDGAVLW